MNKRVLTSALVVWASFSSLPAAEKPSEVALPQLLAQYAQTQDKARSFILKVQTVSTGSSYDQAGGLTARDVTTYTEREVHYDGQRVKEIRRIWGYANSHSPDVPEDRPIYISYLWDGKDLYQYSTNTIEGRPPRLKLHRSKTDVVPMQFAHDPLNDVKGGRRLDTVLREAETVSVRETREDIGGSSCYVVDAVTKNGQFTVWMDPQHGYNPAQLLWVHDAPAGQLSWRELRKNVRFEQIDGVWIPMEADIEVAHRSSDYSSEGVTHARRTQFLVNPNHDALRSFVPDDVANGSRVEIVGVWGISYTWQDGQLIPNVDSAAIDAIDRMTAEIVEVNEVPPGLGKDDRTEPVTATAEELLARYAGAQAPLRSLYAKGESQIEKERGEGQEPLRASERSEFSTDGERIAYRVTQGNAGDRDAGAEYRSLLWNGEYLMEYRGGHGASGDVLRVEKTKTGKIAVTREYEGAALLGICPGDDERVDEILRRADSLTLASQTEQIMGMSCHVLEASTGRGRYRVWIDPRHGYGIARIEVRRDKDRATIDPGQSGRPVTFVMKDVGFQKVDGVWVPVQATLEQTEKSGKRSTLHRRTEIIVNPDHAQRRSFVLEGIRNGTPVVVSNEPDVPYVWRDGTFVLKGSGDVIR
jgi:hypothetical protein